LLSGPDAGTRVPWRDWLTELAEHRATRILTPLAEAVRGVEETERMGRPEAEPDGEPERLTIHRVLRLLDGGRRMPLARALNARLPEGDRMPGGDQPEQDPLAPLAEALAVLIGAQLVGQGTAYWAMNWTGPSILVPPDGIAPETIRTWADTAVRLPGQTQRLGLHLAALGVDERAPLPYTGPAGNTKARRVSIAPGATGPARRRITAVRALALTVLVGLTGLTFVLWANRDEPSYPGTPVTRWNDRYQPGGGTGTGPTPFPTYQRPTFPAWPTPPAYHLPSGSVPSIHLPSIHIEPVIPRSTP
ncbi:M48 family metalloprotease, partial [Streptomyces tendae]